MTTNSGRLVGVVGSRPHKKQDGTWNLPWVMKTIVAQVVTSLMLAGSRIVSGGAKGPDTDAFKAAEPLAKALRQQGYVGMEPIVLEADWSADCNHKGCPGYRRKDGVAYCKKAGFERNSKLALMVEELHAFWDWESGGTLDTIRKAAFLGKPVYIYDPAEPRAMPTKWKFSDLLENGYASAEDLKWLEYEFHGVFPERDGDEVEAEAQRLDYEKHWQ